MHTKICFYFYIIQKFWFVYIPCFYSGHLSNAGEIRIFIKCILQVSILISLRSSFVVRPIEGRVWSLLIILGLRKQSCIWVANQQVGPSPILFDHRLKMALDLCVSPGWSVVTDITSTVDWVPENQVHPKVSLKKCMNCINLGLHFWHFTLGNLSNW